MPRQCERCQGSCQETALVGRCGYGGDRIDISTIHSYNTGYSQINGAISSGNFYDGRLQAMQWTITKLDISWQLQEHVRFGIGVLNCSTDSRTSSTPRCWHMSRTPPMATIPASFSISRSRRSESMVASITPKSTSASVVASMRSTAWSEQLT